MTPPTASGPTPAYPASDALLTRARATDAALAARPGVLGNAHLAPGSYPVFADRASGAHVWDVDGRRYLDLVLGFGSVVLGHADPDVTDAVVQVLRSGVTPTLASPLQPELAELITTCSPAAERVAFLKTGSDATTAAVRLARATTGRRHVLRWGYNGWQDWCADRPAGLIAEARAYATTFPYNDIEALEALVAERAGDLAAILLMPMEVDEPAPGYLAAIRDLAHRAGAAFILDEVRTGFRLALGGAQEHYGIEADITTYSKAMANGHAISAVAGSRHYLDSISQVSMSSTFFRAPDGMAAALATIRKLRDTAAFDVLWRRGGQVKAAIDEAAAAAGVPARGVGLDPLPFIAFDLGSPEAADVAIHRFCTSMLEHGVLVHPAHHWFTSAAMSDDDIAHFKSAARAALGVVAATL